jgi:predicted  nucleic acid-binding Zn-ribbon protein
MGLQAAVTDRILGAVQDTQGCDLDTLAESVPELTWNQVFLEIDRLSREGEILVTCETGGRYLIQLPEHKKGPKTHHVRP